MSKWKECELGDVVEIKYGKDHKALLEGTIPVYGTGGIMRYAEKAISCEESILIPRKGSLNNIYHIKEPFWTVDTLFWTKINHKEVFAKYLFYQLTTIDFTAMNVGSAVPSLTVGVLNEIDITLPSLPEQKAIAAVLSSLDDKIDLLHRQNKTLEAMAETLFRQWFIEEAQEDWTEGCLGDIASFHNGKKRPDSIVGGKIPIYGGNGVFGYSDNFNYEDTTVIIGRVGAYCGSLYIEYNPIWVSDNALVAKPLKNKHSCFLFFLLKNLSLNEMAEGSSHPLLTQTLLKSIPIFLPPTELIESFVFQVDIWLNKINFNNNQIRTLETLRDNLLPKLMSGEVRVKL